MTMWLKLHPPPRYQRLKDGRSGVRHDASHPDGSRSVPAGHIAKRQFFIKDRLLSAAMMATGAFSRKKHYSVAMEIER